MNKTLFIPVVLIVLLIGSVVYREELTAKVKEYLPWDDEVLQGSTSDKIVCENTAIAVRIMEVTDSNDQFTTGKGVVIEPTTEAGKEIPVSVPKKFAVGQTVKQCVNIVIE